MPPQTLLCHVGREGYLVPSAQRPSRQGYLQRGGGLFSALIYVICLKSNVFAALF